MHSCKHFNNIAVMKLIYFTAVISKFEYASQVWFTLRPRYLSLAWYWLWYIVERTQLCMSGLLTRGIYSQVYLEINRRHQMGRLLCVSYFSFAVPRSCLRSFPTFLLPLCNTNLLHGSPCNKRTAMYRAANLHYSDIFVE